MPAPALNANAPMSAMNDAAGIAPMGARRSFDSHGLEPWLQQQGSSATSSPISDALRGTPAPAMASGGQPWWQGMQDAQNARQAQEVAALNAKKAQDTAAAQAQAAAQAATAQPNYGEQNYGW
jgi:hypothetical protein